MCIKGSLTLAGKELGAFVAGFEAVSDPWFGDDVFHAAVFRLEAEEAGIRSTGIGCYFDDPVHEVFGISSRDWQSFYHFTVGGPVEDGRLTTLPPYSLGEAG